jgi:hypothetical protein
MDFVSVTNAVVRLVQFLQMADFETPKAQTTQSEAKRPPTPEEFITIWPLYTPAPIEDFEPPDRVSFHCGNLPVCGKETTWMKIGNVVDFAHLDGVKDAHFKWVWYVCVLCNETFLLVLYREVEWAEQRAGSSIVGGLPRIIPPAPTRTVVTKVLKIGQYPAQSIVVPKELQKNLGPEGIALYQKALIIRNQGYGLGAVTYIRRVVEDKTNELIEVAAKLAESLHVDAKIVEQTRAAATERTTYDKKLKIAATVLPDALLINGINPLAELYNLVSEGVHGLSEEDCVAVADETTKVFQFIFTNLRAQTQARQGFVEAVTKWANRGSKTGKTP